jgi:hypothetical protein
MVGMESGSAGRTKHHRVGLLSPAAVFALLFAPDALAYLDPGTGSILLQGLVAAVAATLTWLSLYWRRAKGWMQALTGRTSAAPDDPDQQAPH